MKYRHTFSWSFSQQLQQFALQHQYNGRYEFKYHWNQWVNENESFVQQELLSHQQNGYTGDFDKKMYDSVRFYYYKKLIPTKRCSSPKKTQPNKFRLPKNILIQINQHILQNITIKPSKSYQTFIHNYNHDHNNDAIVKKAYKNQYNQIIKKKHIC